MRILILAISFSQIALGAQQPEQISQNSCVRFLKKIGMHFDFSGKTPNSKSSDLTPKDFDKSNFHKPKEPGTWDEKFQVRWIGEKIPENILKYWPIKTHPWPKYGSIVTSLDSALRLQYSEHRGDLVFTSRHSSRPGQLLVKNGPYENALIHQMMSYPISREVALAVIYDGSGNKIGSSDDIAVGSNFEIPLDRIYKMIDSIGLQLKGKPPIVLEIPHTHTVYDIAYKFRSEGALENSKEFPYQMIIHEFPLNGPDIREYKKMSLFFPDIYLRSKAVLPNGYSYCITFLNGNEVVDPLIKSSGFSAADYGSSRLTDFLGSENIKPLPKMPQAPNVHKEEKTRTPITAQHLKDLSRASDRYGELSQRLKGKVDLTDKYGTSEATYHDSSGFQLASVRYVVDGDHLLVLGRQSNNLDAEKLIFAKILLTYLTISKINMELNQQQVLKANNALKHSKTVLESFIETDDYQIWFDLGFGNIVSPPSHFDIEEGLLVLSKTQSGR